MSRRLNPAEVIGRSSRNEALCDGGIFPENAVYFVNAKQRSSKSVSHVSHVPQRFHLIIVFWIAILSYSVLKSFTRSFIEK